MRNGVIVRRSQARTRIVYESHEQEESSKAPRCSNFQSRVSLLRSSIITICTLTIVAGVCMTSRLENFSRCNPPSDSRQRPIMLQMNGNSVVRHALQENPTRFIQDRRNHYWRDHGVTWNKGGRESFGLEEGCEILGDWQEEHNPSCNNIHEIDMTEFFHKSMVLTTDKFVMQTNHRNRETLGFITSGGFRNAWMVSEHDGTKRVLKTLRYVEKLSFDERTFERHRVDAVAMEQLTASPYVADVYGYCANSALVDYSSHGDLYSIFSRGDQPTKDERFKIALDTASAVADMHHFNSNGMATMVHKDMKPVQWILIDGMYKLNDFNLGKFLSWNPERKQYCGYSYGYGSEWEAPEQFLESAPLTHKADVYSLGNVLYFLLTGRKPFSSMTYSQAEKEIRKGKRPEIDASILNSEHPFHVSLRTAIDMCMVFDPEKRPDARSVAAFLRKSLADYNRTAIS